MKPLFLRTEEKYLIFMNRTEFYIDLSKIHEKAEIQLT